MEGKNDQETQKIKPKIKFEFFFGEHHFMYADQIVMRIKKNRNDKNILLNFS